MEKFNLNGRIYPKGIFVKVLKSLKNSMLYTKTLSRKEKIKSIFNE